MRPRAVPLDSLPAETVLEIVVHISDNLREADLIEVEAVENGPPRQALLATVVYSSLAWVILDRHSTPIALFGVCPTHLPDVGSPWFVATPAMETEGLAVARHTRRFVREMQALYPVLTNFVDAENDLALDWLLWAGFDLIDAVPAFGPQKRLFLQFSRTIECAFPQ